MSHTDGRSVEMPTTNPPYRPVVIVHGMMTGDVSTMEHLAARITELHPGTKTYVFDKFCGLASLEPLWRQVKQLAVDLLRVCSLHPEGVHVIGYSQGGLISRGMLEMYGAEHNVRTFVSLSSPQGGQYGAECFTTMFPALTARTAYEVFYTRLGQHAVSVANYWFDPRHRDLYLEYSLYLAVIDNIKGQDTSTTVKTSANSSTAIAGIINDTPDKVKTRVSDAISAVAAATVKVSEGHDCSCNNDAKRVTSAATVDEILARVVNYDPDNLYEGDDNGMTNAKTRKLGLTRLQRLVLVGGPDDGVISPWQSSQFAILDVEGGLVPMRERLMDDVYSHEDPIGLRELDTTNRLVEYTVPNIGHHEWHSNEKVLRECIIGWLD